MYTKVIESKDKVRIHLHDNLDQMICLYNINWFRKKMLTTVLLGDCKI